jgi:hypothetical protein
MLDWPDSDDSDSEVTTILKLHGKLICIIGSQSQYAVLNRIDGIMVSMLASSAIDGGFEHQSGQAKDYKIGVCCFFAKIKGRLGIKIMCLEWTHRLLFQWASTMKIQLSVLV